MRIAIAALLAAACSSSASADDIEGYYVGSTVDWSYNMRTCVPDRASQR
jgi:hypothetical protein